MLQSDEIVNHILHYYKSILDDWIPKEAAIAIAHNNQYIYFQSNNPLLHITIGHSIKENSVAFKVLSTGKRIESFLENTLFNTPYFAIGYPIVYETKLAALIIILPHPIARLKTSLTSRFITGRLEDELYPVPVDEIQYIESLQKHTWFYGNNNSYRTSITLKELELKLPKNFIRIHRSYIINSNFILKLSKDITSNYMITLQNNLTFPVSQTYLHILKNELEF